VSGLDERCDVTGRHFLDARGAMAKECGSGASRHVQIMQQGDVIRIRRIEVRHALQRHQSIGGRRNHREAGFNQVETVTVERSCDKRRRRVAQLFDVAERVHVGFGDDATQTGVEALRGLRKRASAAAIDDAALAMPLNASTTTTGLWHRPTRRSCGVIRRCPFESGRAAVPSSRDRDQKR
jgi:hypothetical protein